MFRQALICSISLVALVASAAWADPKDDIQAAVQKLADSPSYTWSTAVEGSSRPPSTGKTEKDGYTRVTLQARDNTFEIIIKGNQSAIQSGNSWKTAAEVIAANTPDSPPTPELFAARVSTRFETPSQQAADNIDKLQNIQKTDDGYTADLNPEDAKQLMLGRHPTTGPSDAAPQMDITDPKCSFKFWITDGTLTKVQIHASGTISFGGGDGRSVDRTSTTEITDIGSTKVDVPDDVKTKLGS